MSQDYSDPDRQMELPFPFPGDKPSDRFDLHDPSTRGADTFTYMGRHRFAHLLDQLPIPPAVRFAPLLAADVAAAEASQPTSTKSSAASAAASAIPSLPPSEFFPPLPANAASRPVVMFMYGTIGWGKSHLLAAMVCLLLRKGRKIVYLPDCKVMLSDPVKYVRSALLLTFASEPEIQRQAAELQTAEQIVAFCDRFPHLTYVIDQFNALEQDTTKDSSEMQALKATTHQMINSATFGRAVVKAASANNLTARVVHDKQLNMNIQTLFGGMDEVRPHSCCFLQGIRLSDYVLTVCCSLLCVCFDSTGGDAAMVSPLTLLAGWRRCLRRHGHGCSRSDVGR